MLRHSDKGRTIHPGAKCAECRRGEVALAGVHLGIQDNVAYSAAASVSPAFVNEIQSGPGPVAGAEPGEEAPLRTVDLVGGPVARRSVGSGLVYGIDVGGHNAQAIYRDGSFGWVAFLSDGYKWYEGWRTFRSEDYRNSYRELGGHSCFATLKWIWWRAKYGQKWIDHGDSSEPPVDFYNAAKEEMRALRASNFEHWKSQAAAMARWQRKWCRNPGSEPGSGHPGWFWRRKGKTVVDETTIHTWSEFVQKLGKDPCCELERRVRSGELVTLGVSIPNQEGAAYRVVAVDCGLLPKCQIIIADWNGGLSYAQLDIEGGGKMTINRKDRVTLPRKEGQPPPAPSEGVIAPASEVQVDSGSVHI